MSNIVSGLVQKRCVGSPTRKSVLLYMADYASEDGCGVWVSKTNIALDLEMGKRTVQNCIDDLLAAGLIVMVGKRACKNGYTVEYSISLPAVSLLKSTRAGDAPVQDVHPARAGRAPQEVQPIGKAIRRGQPRQF